MARLRKKRPPKSPYVRNVFIELGEKEYSVPMTHILSWYEFVGRLICNDIELNELENNTTGGNVQQVVREKDMQFFVTVKDDEDEEEYFLRFSKSNSRGIIMKYIGPYWQD